MKCIKYIVSTLGVFLFVMFFYFPVVYGEVKWSQSVDIGTSTITNPTSVIYQLGQPSYTFTANEFGLKINPLTITGTSTDHIGIYGIYENTSTVIYSDDTRGSATPSPSYCFSPEQENIYQNIMIPFPENITFTKDKYYSIYLARKYNEAQGVCELNANVGGGNDRYAETKMNVANTIIYFQLGNNLTTPNNENIEFVYPTQGMTTPLFSPFLLIGDNLISDYGYMVDVNWYVSLIGSTTPFSETFNNRVYGLGSEFTQNGISVPRTNFNFDLANDTILYFTGVLYGTQDPENSNVTLAFPYVIDTISATATLQSIPSSDDQFIIPTFNSNNPSNTNYSTSSVPVGSIESPFLSLPKGCDVSSTFDFWTPSDWKCVVLNGINDFVANVQGFGSSAFNNMISKIKIIFPISVFSSINNDIDMAQSSTPAITSIVLSGSGNVLSGVNATLFNASSTNWISNTVGFDYRTLFSRIIYLVTGVIILAETYHFIRKLTHTQQQT